MSGMSDPEFVLYKQAISIRIWGVTLKPTLTSTTTDSDKDIHNSNNSSGINTKGVNKIDISKDYYYGKLTTYIYVYVLYTYSSVLYVVYI